jgi:diaminohydroxyphosphoribosylaminopyrimidine deaminase/5-amino-6-(5-phosphoribosylamino)uracil reductase
MVTEARAEPAGSRDERRFDREAMRAALALARRGLGTVWPNPAVGCVIVNDARVVGRGWTQPGGRPHGETEALRRSGEAARGPQPMSVRAMLPLGPYSLRRCTDSAGVRRVVVAFTLIPASRARASAIAGCRLASRQGCAQPRRQRSMPLSDLSTLGRPP